MSDKVSASSKSQSAIVFAAIAFLGVLPLITNYPLARDILIFSLYAMSYAIIQGHMGQVSFGHSTFFGLGAYWTGMLLFWVPLSPGARWLWVVVGIALTTGIAYVLGYITLKKRGAYFALTNLAFLQVFYFIIYQLRDVTGGFDGKWAIPLPTIGSYELTNLSIYYISFGVVAVCILLMKLMFNDSSFGLVLHGIRENENRVVFLGYNSQKYMVNTYTISGMFAGIAGSLYVLHLDYVGLTFIHWFLAMEGILMSMLGGMHVFVGPIVGATLYYFLKDTVGSTDIMAENWPLVVGIFAMGLILFLKEGILGAFKKLRF